MVLSGAEYLIAVMTVFPLFFVVLVLFLFGKMTRNVITRPSCSLCPRLHLWPRRVLPMAKGWAFLGSGPGPSADINMGFSVLYPPHYPNVLAQRRHWHGLFGFIPPHYPNVFYPYLSSMNLDLILSIDSTEISSKSLLICILKHKVAMS